MSTKASSPKKKSASVRRLINQGIEVLQAFGVPLAALSDRKREQASMCFLAVAGVTHPADWPAAATHPGPPLRTRQIISFINAHFHENVSPGSYDDVRRKHLLPAINAGVVTRSAAKPDAATNDPTRGYGIDPDVAVLIRSFGKLGWHAEVGEFLRLRKAAAPVKPTIAAQPLVMPDGTELQLGPGLHNVLQRSIIEQFRPRFADGSAVLYLGDSDERELHKDSKTLEALGINISAGGSLPDVIIWDEQRKWILLIEAVHSFGAISPARVKSLDQLCSACKYPRVFVTAFLDRNAFRKWAPEIAWETEVWIADEPDHMIHFNGDRFFGPHHQPATS